MGSVDYSALAKEIVAKIGGEKNVSSVTHCATRLRFMLQDNSKVKKQEIKELPGVITIVESGGQFQIVIGNNVSKVYAQLGAMTEQTTKDSQSNKEQTWLGKAVDIVASIFAPMLGTMAAVGILKGLLVMASTFGWIANTSTTYQILYLGADAFFLFLPMILAVTSSRKFGSNIYTSLTLAGALLYTQLQPVSVLVNGKATNITLSSFAKTGGEVTFLGIPVVLQNYTSTVIPIILAVWAQSWLEKLLNRFIHESVRNFVVPVFSLIIMVPLTLITLGPAGVYVGDGIAFILQSAYNVSPVISAILIAALWQIMVIFGVHWGIVPAFINNIAVNGFDPLKAACFPAVLSQAGAAFGVFLRTKHASSKAIAGSAALAGIFGITEPAIYGVTLPRKRPFVIGVISAAIGGAIIGFGGVLVYGSGAPGLLTLPIGLNPKGDNTGFIFLVIATATAWLLAAIGTYFFGFSQEDLAQDREKWEKDQANSLDSSANPNPRISAHQASSEAKANDASSATTTRNLQATNDGILVQLAEVPDPVFSTGALGAGLGIKPETSEDFTVSSPVSGTITTVMPSKHAYAITTDDQVELLIHIGIDTVKLAGNGFTSHVEKGQRITTGQPLATVSGTALKAANLDNTVLILVTNSDDHPLEIIESDTVKTGQTVATFTTREN